MALWTMSFNTSWISTFLVHVPGIIKSSSKKKVLRINAGRIVAFVEHK